MRIAVIDVPASETGALSILKSFISHIDMHGKSHEWYVVVSTDALHVAGSHVHVIVDKYPKKSWGRRILWELFLAPQLMRKLNPDVIVSLQNTSLLFTDKPQVVYVHQSLPFLRERKWSLLKREERVLRIYTEIFYHLIKKAARRAKTVVVQTAWMKRAVADASGVSRDKIIALLPPINLPSASIAARIPGRGQEPSFFYPTTSFVYKNIDIVLQALKHLKSKGITPCVMVTIRGDENNYARRVRREALKDGLNVVFLGAISRDEVMRRYAESVLLFPSLVETIGLPLLEASTVGANIIASDRPFSREVLEGYPRVRFFDPGSPKELAMHMENALANVREETSHAEAPVQAPYSGNTWAAFVKHIENALS
jgi:glycosyltransferase involved in cell wall biosynthesis